MSRSSKEAIVLVVDVGPSVSQHASGCPSFLDESINCIIKILHRKMFADNCKDELAVMLFGTPETNNALADGDQYQHISLVRPLAPVNWELIKQVQNKINGSTTSADWLDALVVALDYLQHATKTAKFTAHKIVLLTNFGGGASDSEVDVIISGMKDLNVDLSVIGPHISLSAEDEGAGGVDNGVNGHCADGEVGQKAKSREQVVGESLIYFIIQAVDGIICSFEEAIPQLLFFHKKMTNSIPWNAPLDIGPSLTIPITGWTKMKRATPPSWSRLVADAPDEKPERETSYHRLDEMQTEVRESDIIEGYRFGSTLVPFSDDDRANMCYFCDAPRSLSVLGFTKSSNIQRHLFMGDQVLYITSQKNNQAAAGALSALVRAMEELSMVAICRRMYNKNNRASKRWSCPRLGVLIPRVKSEYECLVWLELPFMEDLRQYTFAPLPTDKVSDEQMAAIDGLIDSMDLMTADSDEGDDPCEAFQSRTVLNPHFQHLYQVLTHRALNPGHPLPPVDSKIKEILQRPQSLSQASETKVAALSQLFKLEEVKPKQKKKTGAEVFSKDDEPAEKRPRVETVATSLSELNRTPVQNVGTTNPVADFTALIARADEDHAIYQAFKQIESVVEGFVLETMGTAIFPKALDCVKTYRTEATHVDPDVYNKWVRRFKVELKNGRRSAFWDEIVRGGLGLISMSDNPRSHVTPSEARTFLESEEQEEVLAAGGDREEDAEDLLGEL